MSDQATVLGVHWEDVSPQHDLLFRGSTRGCDDFWGGQVGVQAPSSTVGPRPLLLSSVPGTASAIRWRVLNECWSKWFELNVLIKENMNGSFWNPLPSLPLGVSRLIRELMVSFQLYQVMGFSCVSTQLNSNIWYTFNLCLLDARHCIWCWGCNGE